MKTNKILSLTGFLMSTVTGLQSASPADVEKARYVATATNEIEIPADKLFELRDAIDKKIRVITDEGDDQYSMQTLQELARAMSGVDNQISIYERKFAATKDGLTTEDLDTDDKTAELPGIDPVLAARELDAGKLNGAGKTVE